MKTNYKTFECIFDELPKTIIKRVDDRIKDSIEIIKNL